MTTDRTLQALVASSLASRIWTRETAPFNPTGDTAVSDAVRNRLGWLGAPEDMAAHLPAVTAFVEGLRADGLTEIYLLGMGGSSLCAEVLRDVAGTAAGLSLTVLDTTDECAVRRATDALTPARACFLVASKSGSTVEVTSLERHFRSVMEASGVAQPGRHFFAITDPGTSLVAHASGQGYRHTFINPPDIGGRYSALSLFGLVPAAICGIPAVSLLDSARSMASACRQDDSANPGLQLGVFMGAHAEAGRDKLTLLIAPALAPLGPWIEQLVAESTGKMGRGVLPVVDEPIGDTQAYGPDRAFVAVLTADSQAERAAADRLEAAGHPVFRIDTDATSLGAEFFRWEFATAVAGAVLGVNPFDEPDVRGAKARTQAQLDARAATGHFRIEPSLAARDGAAVRESRPAGGAALAAGGYIAILDYLPQHPARTAAIARLRVALRARTGLATTHGSGPRYLHSTGQYHKGGPNTGVFVLFTAADATATEVPGAGYTFSVLKRAQALGDVDALVAAGRTVIHWDLDRADADFGAELERLTGLLG